MSTAHKYLLDCGLTEEQYQHAVSLISAQHNEFILGTEYAVKLVKSERAKDGVDGEMIANAFIDGYNLVIDGLVD